MDANGFRVRVRCGVRVQRSNRRTLSTASDGARTERGAFLKRAHYERSHVNQVKSSQFKSSLTYLYSEGTYVSTYDVSPLDGYPSAISNSPSTPVLPCFRGQHMFRCS